MIGVTLDAMLDYLGVEQTPMGLLDRMDGVLVDREGIRYRIAGMVETQLKIWAWVECLKKQAADEVRDAKAAAELRLKEMLCKR